MSKVSYNQSGYVGQSMSKRAVWAYEDGEMPKSKWTKRAMIAAITDFCEEEDLDAGSLNLSKRLKNDIFEDLLEWKAWHHTGKYAQETDFYGVNEDAIRKAASPLPPEVRAEREAERKRQRIIEEAEYWVEAAKRAAMVEKDMAWQKHTEQLRADWEEEHSGISSKSYEAYEIVFPERCERFVSKAGNNCARINHDVVNTCVLVNGQINGKYPINVYWLSDFDAIFPEGEKQAREQWEKEGC